VTTHPKKTEGAPKDARSTGQMSDTDTTGTALTVDSSDQPNRRSRRLIVITDDLLFDREISDITLFTLGLALAYSGRNPSKPQYKKHLPINDRQIAEGRRDVPRQRLSHLKYPEARDPVTKRYYDTPKLVGLAERADPSRRRFVIVPADLTAQLRGTRKGALRACRLLALYCLEQLRAGAVQVGDREAAWLLGWTETGVAAARRRLLKRGIITVATRTPQTEPDIYIVPDSVPLPDPERFQAERTRHLRPIFIGDEEREFYANAAEVGKIAVHVREALSAHTPTEIIALAGGTEENEPIHAKMALSGSLERAGRQAEEDRRATEQADQALRKRATPLSGNGLPPSQGTESTSLCTTHSKTSTGFARTSCARRREEELKSGKDGGDGEAPYAGASALRSATPEDEAEAFSAGLAALSAHLDHDESKQPPADNDREAVKVDALADTADADVLAELEALAPDAPPHADDGPSLEALLEAYATLPFAHRERLLQNHPKLREHFDKLKAEAAA
jgi:hypothetical protein